MAFNSEERLSARITGRVQGVGFRHYSTIQARRLDINGWVRNEPDGSVRLEAEGGRENLERFLRALRAGPRSARVEQISTDWKDRTGEFDEFSVRYQ